MTSLPMPDKIVEDNFTTDKLRGSAGNDHLIHHRDPSVEVHSGTGMTSYAGDDILEASVPKIGQIHMMASEGDDWMILDVTKYPDAIGAQGHHAYGGPGRDTFQFTNIENNASPIVGRLDDYNPTSDRIFIEDTEIDLSDLPNRIYLPNGDEVDVRVIEIEHPEFRAEELGAQHFLAIGDTIFYALEGARDLRNGTSGLTGEERHFLGPDALDTLRSAEPVHYQNPVNFVPRDFYEHREEELHLDRKQTGGELSAETGNKTAAYMFGAKSNPEAHSSAGEQMMIGSDGDDVIDANTGNDTVNGAAGNDLIATGIDNDVADGGSGDDMLWGGDGDDTLNGGTGDDFLHGGRGDDFLFGGQGHDTLFGGEGNNTLVGGSGNDTILGGDTEDDLRDVVYADDGDDSVDGGYGNDELYGMSGNDTMEGGFGVDRLVGGDGDDVLNGNALSDQIFGGDGFDFINGGFGSDRLNGGEGADQFFHVGIAGHGSDWIQDFDTAEGDVLLYGGGHAAAGDFLVQIANTAGAGDADVAEAFITHRVSGNLLWALVDGDEQGSINVQIGGEVFDLLA